jgi:hypothetical protein
MAASAPSDWRRPVQLRSKHYILIGGTEMATDDKVVIGQTHALDDPEAVLIGYLMGVEALRKDKQVVMWLTKDAVQLATPDFAATVEVPGAPRSSTSTRNTSSAAVASSRVRYV